MKPIETEVVVADYHLLRQSFPCALGQKTDAEINEWLKREAGYFRESHLDAIPEGSDRPAVITSDPARWRKTGRVPPNYGRAVVMRVSGAERCAHDMQWLDVKGSGTDSPKWESFHKSGVLELTGALQEFFMEKWISFLHDLPDRTRAISGVNPSFAVLAVKHVECPYPLMWEDENGHIRNMTHGWGLVVRQYAERDPSYVLDVAGQYAVEGWLRRHGLSGFVTALYNYYPEARSQDPAELPLVLDYQRTKDRKLIDFSVLGLYQEEDPRRWHWDQPAYPVQYLATFDPADDDACYDVKKDVLIKETLQECLTYLAQRTPQLIKSLSFDYLHEEPAQLNRLGLRRSLHPLVFLTGGYYFFLGTFWWDLWEPSERAFYLPQLIHSLANHRLWQPHYQEPVQHLFTTFQLRLYQAYDSKEQGFAAPPFLPVRPHDMEDFDDSIRRRLSKLSALKAKLRK